MNESTPKTKFLKTWRKRFHRRKSKKIQKSYTTDIVHNKIRVFRVIRGKKTF